MKETIGWIGVGSMGHRMSRHLGVAGYPLVVADAASTERAPAGAAIAKSNAEVAAARRHGHPVAARRQGVGGRRPRAGGARSRAGSRR